MPRRAPYRSDDDLPPLRTFDLPGRRSLLLRDVEPGRIPWRGRRSTSARFTTVASPAARRPRRMPSHALGPQHGTVPLRTDDLAVAYSFLDLAYEVLKESDRPLTYREVWDAASAAGLPAKLKTSGRTPAAGLGSRLYADIREHPGSRFVGVGKRPTGFYLAEGNSELPRGAGPPTARKQPRSIPACTAGACGSLPTSWTRARPRPARARTGSPPSSPGASPVRRSGCCRKRKRRPSGSTGRGDWC